MAELAWAVLCEKALVEERAKVISLISLIEELTVHGPEEFFAENSSFEINYNHTLVMLWRRSDLNVEEKLVCEVNVEGDPVSGLGNLNTLHIDLDLLENRKRTRAIINFPGIKVSQEGVLWFIITLNSGNEKKEVARIPIEVIFKKNETPPSN